MTPPVRFGFRFDPRYARLARRFGVHADNAWVEVSDTGFEARYGPWRVASGFENVAGVEITGPYRMFKTAGPARLGVTDLGITFASNRDRGVLVTFHRRVKGIERAGLLKHGEITVTVEDVEGLAALLRERAGV